MEGSSQTRFPNDVTAGEALSVKRYFTTAGQHAFDTVDWETRDARIAHGDRVAFEQRDVEFPSTWSQNATNIVAQKYFRGQLGSAGRERSVKQMIGRVAGTIADWGRSRGYFASVEDGDAFEAELTYILVHQMAAFNSPVWFNVGFEESPQCSACQPYRALISTPDGMVQIGDLVHGDQVGREVYDAHGVTRIVGTKANGIKPVYRVVLRNGSYVEATADHVVKAVRERGTEPQWLRVDELEAGMRMHLHPHRAKVASRSLVPAASGSAFGLVELPEDDAVKVSEAALAGWLQADGFVGEYDHGTNRSLTIEFLVANAEERAWVEQHLDVVFPDVHRNVRDADTLEVPVQRIRLYGEVLGDFVERWNLLERGIDITVPYQLWTASHEEIAAYLRSVFQADGWVSVRRENGCESARVGFAVVGEQWTEEIQILLGTLGIYSRRTRKHQPRANRHDMHEVAISIGSERARFAELVGFVDARKQGKLLESLGLRNPKRCPDLREEQIVAIQALGRFDVYDIQTESGEYLSNNVAVHNCFILSVEDTMDSILDWNTKEGKIFLGGSGSGINLSNIRSSKEPLSKGGTASGPVSFMRGADSWAGTIKSGGKTRRAAKMVVLDVDHPDIREFIWCKAEEEKKANALRDAGFDMSIDGEGFRSIQYQNANNSVRLTDDFMRAVENDADWHLIARTTGQPVGDPIPARELMREIAEAAWQCADPGVQYDTTINQWHTCPESGRINASNPCFPADARVHTTLGLLPIGELIARGEAGEQLRVYTHRATAETAGAGVFATEPIAFMRNGVKPIVRLSFANGAELRCTPNHRLWTINRGYVRADELESADRVLLNDAATPATDAAWALPASVTTLAKSCARGGSVTYQELPDRWSEGLGELTGHLIGDGWLTDVQTGWIYGGDDIADGMTDSHEGMLRELIGGISRQEMANGTVQLRAGSEAVREFFRGVGVTCARAHDKRVPSAIFTAPVEVQAAFLRGLFGADGCVSRVESGGKATRYVGLGSRSNALLKDVQRMLNTFGVRGRIYRITDAREASFSYTRNDGTVVEYASREGFDLRITGGDLARFATEVGFSAPRKQAALDALLDETRQYATKPGTALLVRDNDGQEEVYNLTEPLHHSYIVDGFVVANCSEYMHVDDSACNLASLNLMKFRRADGSFDVPSFEHAVDVMLLAQEILVGPSSYPTEQIGINARAFRQLGLGYANLGAYLMSNGMAYDSDAGRGTAAAITSLMTGRAYLESARVAAAIGPYERYEENRDAHNAVMRMHRDASGAIPDAACADKELLAAARAAWNEAVATGDEHGYRNAQATVLAPTGCLVENSLVSTSRGLVRLRSLGDVDGAKWQDLDVRVATDEGPRAATKFYVNGMEQVVSVQTARGYRIQGTPAHRIKVIDGESNWVWKRMADIAPGDRVPMMLNSLVGEPNEVALPPLGELHWNADRATRVPRTVSAELAELVGYFMGDGSLHAKGIRLCVTDGDDDVLERLVELGRELFGLEAHATPCEGYTEVSLHSVPLTIWWEACGFSKLLPFEGHTGKGWSAHIPDAILHSNDPEVYAGFIRGLFEADGNANHGYAYWSTTCEDFSRDVQTLLLALGFVTTRGMDGSRVKWGAPCHRIRLLNAATGMRFATQIGFMSSRKNQSLIEADHAQAARYDHVPVGRELVDELAPENDSLRKTMLMSIARKGTVSRRSATTLLERTSSIELEQLLGYFYDEVATTELLEDQPTFDLSVPDNVTYVANGFVSHNTISFLMDCDTTGVEPDFSLVKFKELVGGGQMTIVNQTIPMALRTLGYTDEQIEVIERHIDEHATIVGAPGLAGEHLSIFDVAVGERAISHMGHIKMMGAVQPFISGAISKCVAGDTLVASDRGLVRIGALHNGESPDSFRDMELTIASLDGERSTDAYYYGGTRPVREVTLRSGHKVVGTDNHRLLTCGVDGLSWRRLDELQPGEYVATQYGDDMWSVVPASFADFVSLPRYGSQKVVTLPVQMTEKLAFFLGAFAAEGHIARSNHTICIANADEHVISRLVADAESLFGFTPRVSRQPDKCPSVDLSSKRLIEFLDYLGAGSRACDKRIPDAILRSPRSMVLAFLEGLCLDAYLTTGAMAKWAICLDSPRLLDDLQAVLTNLGVVHGRISKYNATYDKSFDEVYCCGRETQRLVGMIGFVEAHKQRAADAIAARTFRQSTADVIPGISGAELYELLPLGRSGRGGAGTSVRPRHRHLVDARTKHVSRESVVRLSQQADVELPAWLETVVERNLHFSPVAGVTDVEACEVYDVSVPVTHAFVANGMVNHNTVNLPYEATVEDIADAYVQAWHCGVKALAIYRDGSKTAQALRTDAQMGKSADASAEGGFTQEQVDELIAEAVAATRARTLAEVSPKRNRMPRERQSITHKFSIAGHEGYITAGMYEDGTLGEIFLTDIGKEGSTLRGLLNSFATSISIALQYGVPLEKLVEKFSYMRFEPEGITQNPEIPFAKSMPDYIMRWLASRFLDTDIQEELGIMTPEVRARKMAEDSGTSYTSSDTSGPATGGNGGAHRKPQPSSGVAGKQPATTRAASEALTDTPPVVPVRMRGLDLGPACNQCGGMMQRTGSCYTCSSCGNNTGCG